MPVHGTVDRVAGLVETGAPVVVPETAPVLALLEADWGDFFNGGQGYGRRGGGG